MDKGILIIIALAVIGAGSTIYAMSWFGEHNIYVTTGKVSTVSHQKGLNYESTILSFFGTEKSVEFWGFHDFTVGKTYVIKYHGTLSQSMFEIDLIEEVK